MKYKHFIIGSGIAGLHIALQLLDKNETDFLIVEKDDFNKSKIFSIKNTVLKKDGTSDNVLIEMGPSVFHDKQVELMKLLKKLDLEHTFDYVDPKSKAYFVYPGMTSEEAKKLWKELKKKVFELTDENITLEEGAKKVLTKNEYNLLKTCWGEWYEINDTNLQVLKKSLKEEGKYIVMKDGLTQIIERATSLIEASSIGKYKIQYNCGIKKVVYDGSIYTVYDCNDKVYTCENLYLCANLKSAREIEFEGIPEVREYLGLAKLKHCLRCYVYFDKAINIPYKFIMGKYLGKYSIKYSDNLWLVAYPDDILALKLYNMPKERFINDWIEMINREFNLSLKYEDTLNKFCGYWEDAYCVLNKDFYKKGNELRLRLKSKNILVTTLPKDNGEDAPWMEGYLFNI
jgi:protoporphyrinogen oxidase